MTRALTLWSLMVSPTLIPLRSQPITKKFQTGVMTGNVAQMNGLSHSTQKNPEAVPILEVLETSVGQVEEAYATWQDSHRLMSDVANARSFWVITSAPGWASRHRPSKCKGKRKGKREDPAVSRNLLVPRSSQS